MARPLKLLAAVAALALISPAVAGAHTGFVADPDEPGNYPDRFDIETAGVEHPPSVSDRLVRHTIKTRAPYGPAATPRLDIRTPSEIPGKNRLYRIRGTMMLAPDGTRTPVWRSETPAEDPDTVSYTFNLGQIGNPTVYEWRAESLYLIQPDRVPDLGWLAHRIVPWTLADAGFRP
jgi:hypothetical protein